MFIANLINVFGRKECAFCFCKIEKIIDAAHIYNFKDIKNNNDLSKEEKQKLIISSDNGIFLCKNHHKLFDLNYLEFRNEKDGFYLETYNSLEKQKLDWIDNSIKKRKFNFNKNQINNIITRNEYSKKI